MKYKRHYLLVPTKDGREFAFEQLKDSINCLEYLEQIKKIIVDDFGLMIPGIVRREEKDIIIGTIPVGFSSPFLYEGRRLRIPVFIPEEEIKKVVTPYELMEHNFSKRTRCLQALKEIRNLALDMGVEVGVWGSGGLEVYTGLPYTNNNSDLDLLMGINGLNIIKTFYQSINQIGSKYDTKIDLELDLPNGYGVKVAEIFMETEEVLGKSILDVKLISQRDIMQMLNN